MEITPDMIKQLREQTGAGVMDCKRALETAEGDFDQAKQVLSEQGLAMAAKKAHRETAQGLVEAYIHAGGRIGAIVELDCETDFVARTPEFQGLARELAMQVAAMNPLVINEDDVLPETGEGMGEPVLMRQAYIRDPSKNVRQLINETIGKTGENIQVRRFSRFEIGV